ncbi:RNA metabolism protein [Lithospermum erythrorhizon]|uniref:RNA metabolism protein n=1 Tax=Lithospermum erythrorhizon TaxID=34254 RepID=A0AAV3NPJ7_LITER
MDTYDATKMILERIQSLDPENASKIMGYILIQDLGDKELIRLAHGPENNLVSLINQANSFLRPLNASKFVLSSQKIMVPNGENNGFCSYNHGQLKSPNLSCSNGFSRKSPVADIGNINSFESSLASDEFLGNLHVPKQLSYKFDEFISHSSVMSPSGGNDSVIWNHEDHFAPHASPFHRRSCSVNDAYLFEDRDSGGQNGNLLGGWRPCMYFARGFCKNGGSCKFSHTFDASNGDVALVGSLKNMEEFEWLRMKAIQQQKLAAASELIATGPRHSFPYKRSTAAAFMGEEFHNMNSISVMGSDCNSTSRQIYLTFPADSAFTEEDVSKYFSMYGLVQDVRIPYQQKRMFGFVTFVYPETVTLILAKGNPHFVCDSRVLVKPYKEKGKVAEKKLQRHQLDLLERGEFPACLSPTGFDAREPYDFPFGGRAFYNAKEMMLKNKLEEQAELQQAIELQGRRLTNMHLMELKNNYNNHQSRPSFSPAFPMTSRHKTHPQMFQNVVQPSAGVDVEVEQANLTGLDYGNDSVDDVIKKDTNEASGTSDENNDCEGGSGGAKVKLKDADLQESLEHILPDSLFASPTKTVIEQRSLTESVPTETGATYKAALSSTCTTLGTVESVKSCHFQMLRIPSGQGVVEM